MPAETDHVKIYQTVLKAGLLIESIEKEGHSLKEVTLPVTLEELKAIMEIIEKLEEENVALKTELAGVSNVE